MSDPKTFPVIPSRRRDVPSKPHPLRIPWSVAELAYSVYSARYGSSQTLERLAERGGFHAGEMDDYLPDWRERASDLTAARAEIEQLRQQLATAQAARERAEGELSEARDEADSMAFHQAGERARWQRELDQANDRLAAAESRLAKVGELVKRWRKQAAECEGFDFALDGYVDDIAKAIEEQPNV